MRPSRALVMLAQAGLLLAMSTRPALAQEEPAAESPATQLRVALDSVLAEHAFLIIEVMRTGLVSGAEYDAAGDALNQNTDALVGAITSIYGEAAGDAVDQQWRNHIAFIVDYARALATNDSAAADLADGQLEQYAADFSALLAGAIELPDDVVAGLIIEHVDQLKQVASFDAADFGDAYPAIRATYDHMFMIGDGLAGGITSQFPRKFRGSQQAFSAATDLRIKLDRLFGEHTQLATLAMRAALTGAPDLAAATAALDENSDALQATIASIYGDTAAGAFAMHWRHHTDLYLDYVAATVDDDDSGRQAALDALRSYRSDFTAFLAGANPFLPADDFESLIREHTNLLVQQADSYAEGDFAAAYATQREAWTQIGALGAGLAAAIAHQFPDQFPDAAMQGRQSAPWWPAALLFGLFACLLAIRLVNPHLASAAARRGRGRRPPA
jgi:hypothetical protein